MLRALKHTNYFFDVKHESFPGPLPIIVKKRKGARHMVLRYQPLARALSLTLPYHTPVAQGLEFVEGKRGWVLKQLIHCPPSVPFGDGQVIPVLGREYRIVHIGGRGIIRQREGVLQVPGEAAFTARRVREWLFTQAKSHIAAATRAKADRIGRRVAKITLRDTQSLWGSCTDDGKLSFSWRLVLAPPDICDYVISHEVAHLAELNHSPAFWRVVAELCPHWKASRRWLKAHGDTLYAYGA